MHESIYNATILCTVNTQDENLEKKITTKNKKIKKTRVLLGIN